MTHNRRPRLLIAGQTPPPVTGQTLMTAEIIQQLQMNDRFDLVHIPFRFARGPEDIGRLTASKLLEVIRVWWRLVRARRLGRIDLLLYPIGGPHTAPTVRDLALLPLINLLSDRVVLQFHGGGHADAWREPTLLQRVAAFFYRRANLALVMTDFNRRDPESLGIRNVAVVPHRLPDAFDPRLTRTHRDGTTRLLYVGHLSASKGILDLVHAYGDVASDHPDTELVIVGEALGDPTATQLIQAIKSRGLGEKVLLTGALNGEAKWRMFATSDLLIFPTRHPFESFGLVLVEAMMWGLPVIATDWRGNSEVLGPKPGGLLCPTDALRPALAQRLQEAMRRRDEWRDWGSRNRQRFLSQFLRDAFPSALTDALMGVLDRHRTQQ